MEATTKLDILRAVFLCAWADGEIQAKERQVLSELLARIDLVEEIHSVVKAWMTQAPKESDTLWKRLSADKSTAKTALYQIVNMAAADRVFQFSELMMMHRFREKLGLSPEEYRTIVDEIEDAIGKEIEES